MIRIEELAHPAAPEALFAAIRELPDPVWLDSGHPGHRAGRYDLISAAPLRLLTAQPGGVRATLASARALLDEMAGAVQRAPATMELPFAGGLIGTLSYPAGQELMGLPPHPAEPLA